MDVKIGAALNARVIREKLRKSALIGVLCMLGSFLILSLPEISTAAPTQRARKKRSTRKIRRVCLTDAGDLTYKKARQCPNGSVDATISILAERGARGPAGVAGPQGEQGVQGPQGAQGPQGSQGPAGADGSLAIYGDGSQGDLTLTSAFTLLSANTQYENIDISATATMVVPSGTVLRARGDCNIRGTIAVSTGAQGATRSSGAVGEFIDATVRIAQNGIAQAGGNAQLSQSGTDPGGVVAGFGGQGITFAMGYHAIRPMMYGGAGGGTSAFGDGGDGGGFFAIFCQGTFTLGATGIIRANGGDGAAGTGGGGGGVVVLVSPVGATISGAVEVIGGDGGAAHSGSAAGGGGGGGIFHVISPSISYASTLSAVVNVSGGIGGISVGAGTVSAALVSGGGGGGACGGNGANGGVVFTSGSASGGGTGSSGYIYETLADPTSLVL